MAQFEKWFTQDLTQPVEIRHCESVVFTGDNLSNLVGVNLYVDGEPYSGGGVVKGNVLLSNGVTVPLTGTLDGNKASIVLTSGCFILPGLVGVSIRIDSGDTKTTVLSAVFTCVQSETDSTIDPGTIIPSVQDLIDDIKARGLTKYKNYSYYFKAISDYDHPENILQEHEIIDELISIGFTAQEAIEHQNQYKGLANGIQKLMKKWLQWLRKN